MSAPDQKIREAVRVGRQQVCGDDEPLHGTTRAAQQFNESVYVNATKYGVRTLGIEKGDELVVETYRDRIVIRKNDAE